MSNRLVRIAAPLLGLLAVVLAAAFGLWHRHADRPITSPPSARYAGTLTLVDSFNCCFAGWGGPGWTVGEGSLTGLLWNDMLDLDGRGNYFPELAARVPTTANGGITVVGGDEVIAIHVKPKLHWSDGSPITAADYLAVLLVGSSPEYGQVWSGPICPIRVAGINNGTLVLTFKGVFPQALDLCDFSPVPWEYLQRKYGLTVASSLTASFNLSHVLAMYADRAYTGSALQHLILKLQNDPYVSPHDLFDGPYRIVSWSQGHSAVVAPNRYYTALSLDPRHPRPAAIRLLTPTGDLDAAIRASMAGTLPAGADLVGPWIMYAGPFASTLIPSPSPYRQVAVPLLLFPEHLDLNQANPALRDRRVRQALLYAIDKIAYLRELFGLSASQATGVALTSPFPHAARFSINDQLPANLYNSARARALLTAAGYATSPGMPGRHLHLDFYTPSAGYRARSGQIMQRYWRQIGLDVTLHLINQRANGGMFGGYANDGVLARRRYDIAEYSGAGAIGRDFSILYYQQLDPGQIPDRNHPNGVNFAGVRDRALFSLLDQAQHTVDDDTRRQLYARFQRRMVDQAYWIALYDMPGIMWVKPTIGNFNPYGGYVNYFWNAYQWYVR